MTGERWQLSGHYGVLNYFTHGHRKQSLSTEYISKMRFSRSFQRSPQGISRVNRHNQSWVFIEWKRKMRKNKPRTTFLSVPITGHDRAQEHNTEQVWWREWGQNRRQGPVALVNSLNIPSETRTMSGISIFKHKVFSYLKMAWWIKFKHKEKNPGVHLLMPSVCLKQIFVVAY